MSFQLDPRLESDSVSLGESSNYSIRLINDRRFPWVILVPKVEAITEIYQLDPDLQQQLAADSSVLGRELMELFQGDSLNTGVLGNVVNQLHLHHVVRFKNDVAWPGPVWGFEKAVSYEADELKKRIDLLQGALSVL